MTGSVPFAWSAYLYPGGLYFTETLLSSCQRAPWRAGCGPSNRQRRHSRKCRASFRRGEGRPPLWWYRLCSLNSLNHRRVVLLLPPCTARWSSSFHHLQSHQLVWFHPVNGGNLSIHFPLMTSHNSCCSPSPPVAATMLLCPSLVGKRVQDCLLSSNKFTLGSKSTIKLSSVPAGTYTNGLFDYSTLGKCRHLSKDQMSVFDIRSQSVFFQVQKEILEKKIKLLIDFIVQLNRAVVQGSGWMSTELRLQSHHMPPSGDSCNEVHLQEDLSYWCVTNI